MPRASTSILGSVVTATRQPIAGTIRYVSGHPPRSAASGPAVDSRIFGGVDGFLGEKEFARLNEWQGGLWERLQAEVRNNPRLAETKQKWDKSGLDMTDLLTTTSRDPQLSLAFNYASLLMNNSFFLEGLHGDQTIPVPAEYQALQEKVAAYADGITGGGWLWLVRTGNPSRDVDVVPTFAAGTMLVTNRSQRGRDDLRQIYGEPETSGPTPEPVPENLSGDPSSSTEVPPTVSSSPLTAPRRSTIGASRSSDNWPVPLAVLNLYDLAYLGDRYGVWGKKQYAADWWKSINWNAVVKRSARAGQ